MNKLIKSICVLLAISLLATFQSCKKPNDPKDPDDCCKNPVTVTALNPWNSEQEQGHFSYIDNNQSIYWLYATNWDEYAAKVEPGKQYDIVYKEVKCKDNWCGTNENGIAAGDCVLYNRKCIIIKCLNEKKERSCLESVVDAPTFDDEHSAAISSTGISGNSLHTFIGFSGCSADDVKTSNLYLNRQYNKCAIPALENNIFISKAVNIYKDITCMAYFEKDVCFDLSSVKNYYMSRNLPVPEKVTIRLLIGQNTLQDFTYQP